MTNDAISPEASFEKPPTTSWLACPFVYMNGKKSSGYIYRARAYGHSRGATYPARGEVRKYRLWCSEKDDHGGVRSGSHGKLRMTFYPDQLPDGYEDRLWKDDLLG